MIYFFELFSWIILITTGKGNIFTVKEHNILSYNIA